MNIDTPSANDNRHYDYTDHPDFERTEYAVVIDMVRRGASVLDLACGNGALLSRMIRDKGVTGEGIELSETGVETCRRRGLTVRAGRIDERLPYSDDAFEYAVCNVTIQMVMYPEVLLREMKRVARRQIVTFPNFAFWRNRIDLLVNGRMPRRMLFGYAWYSTGHIHQLSYADFEQLVADVGGLRIVERRLEQGKSPLHDILMRRYPNLFQMLGIYQLERT